MITLGQRNIWRIEARRALVEAVKERRVFSQLTYEAEKRHRELTQVIRATFCAKLDDADYCKLSVNYFKR
jgi:hypothetical protein